MARFSGAQWRPIPINFSSGRWAAVNQVVIHITIGTLAGVDSWLRNPRAQVSYHFGVGRNGTLWQWVDTANTAWHAINGNARGIGLGHEGSAGQNLTAAQLAASARVIRWAAQAHGGVTVRVATGTGQAGVLPHRMWVATDCPGNRIVAQIPELVRAASGAAPASTPTPPPPPRPRPSLNGKEPTVNVVFGPQGRAVIGLPNNITHARLASTGAELTVTWPGSGAQAVTARLNSTTRADIALPAGQQGLIMLERRDDGDGPVYLSWIEPPR